MTKVIPSITKLEKDCQSVDLHKEDFEGDKKGLSELNPAMKVEIKLEVWQLPYLHFGITAVNRHLVVTLYLLAATPKFYCRLPPCPKTIFADEDMNRQTFDE